MSLISISFFVFFTLIFVLYFTCMKNKQWLLLLVGSLVFYAWASPSYLIFLLFSSVTTYLAAKGIKTARKKAGLIFGCAAVLNLAILVFVKYLTLILTSIGPGPAGFNMIVPLGISYYTFMIIGYLTDVYRGVTEPESNFFKYLTFVSFFPHITQGPINRFEDLAPQLFKKHELCEERIRTGIYRILCGLAKKLIIAERLSVYVDRVYGSYSSYDGLTLLAATVFYAIQIYCDFSGYMDMVLGLSHMLGIDMAENFNLPYFSQSIPEFWRRWHITLGAWFKDYLYYPLLRTGMAKRLTGSLKKSRIKFSKSFIRLVPTVIALLITWGATGIWHGASWHYGFWGLYHGMLIILSMILQPSFGKINKKLRIREDSTAWRIFRIVRTFILVDVGYIFFRAPSVKEAFEIMTGIISKLHINASSIANALLPFTEDNTAISYGAVTFVAIAILFAADLIKYKNENKEPAAACENRRYFFAGALLAAIILFGIFGQSSFIYMMY